jgi:hypothetical protein
MMQADVKTGQKTPIVTITEGTLDALAATTRGDHLVFAQGDHALCPDCSPNLPASHLHIYSSRQQEHFCPAAHSPGRS